MSADSKDEKTVLEQLEDLKKSHQSLNQKKHSLSKEQKQKLGNALDRIHTKIAGQCSDGNRDEKAITLLFELYNLCGLTKKDIADRRKFLEPEQAKSSEVDILDTPLSDTDIQQLQQIFGNLQTDLQTSNQKIKHKIEKLDAIKAIIHKLNHDADFKVEEDPEHARGARRSFLKLLNAHQDTLQDECSWAMKIALRIVAKVTFGKWSGIWSKPEPGSKAVSQAMEILKPTHAKK